MAARPAGGKAKPYQRGQKPITKPPSPKTTNRKTASGRRAPSKKR